MQLHNPDGGDAVVVASSSSGFNFGSGEGCVETHISKILIVTINSRG